MSERIPVLVVTGFLGAGKTTLVNRLLSEHHGRRIAVVVNEFGDVPIDGRLVVAADEEIVELANGCVCCTVRGDLVRTLQDLLARRRRRLLRAAPFERVVLETSGLASPGPVVQTLLLEPALAAELVPAGVLALAHAPRIADELARHPEVEEQIGYADRIVLNHVDRADEATLAAAERELRARNALAPIERTTRAQVDLSRVFDEAADPARWAERAAAHGGTHAHTEHVHTVGAGTVVLASRVPIPLDALKIWLQFLASRRSHELWRMKGIFACAGLRHATVVQSVYQFLELGPGAGPPPDESVLVLIGRGLDRAELERGWQRVCGGAADAG